MQSRTDLTIDYVPIEKVIPYARNSRLHDEQQVAQIAASIKEFGFNNPVLIDEGGSIIAGHGRVRAAMLLEMIFVPTIKLIGLTEHQKRAYVIADNRLALSATWDMAMLSVEIGELKESGFDVSLLGMTEAEMLAILGIEDESEAPVVDDGVRHLLLVECKNEPELEKLFDEIRERGFECKVME